MFFSFMESLTQLSSISQCLYVTASTIEVQPSQQSIHGARLLVRYVLCPSRVYAPFYLDILHLLVLGRYADGLNCFSTFSAAKRSNLRLQSAPHAGVICQNGNDLIFVLFRTGIIISRPKLDQRYSDR